MDYSLFLVAIVHHEPRSPVRLALPRRQLDPRRSPSPCGRYNSSRLDPVITRSRSPVYGSNVSPGPIRRPSQYHAGCQHQSTGPISPSRIPVYQGKTKRIQSIMHRPRRLMDFCCCCWQFRRLVQLGSQQQQQVIVYLLLFVAHSIIFQSYSASS